MEVRCATDEGIAVAPRRHRYMSGARRRIAKEVLRVVLGLLVFSFGVHLTIRANIGLAPWDCLGMGISYQTPLSYGLSMTVVSVAILVVDLLLGESVGFGTIIDALCTGNFIQFFNQVDPLPEAGSMPVGVLYMLAGLFVMALGQFLYMGSGQGMGPRDAFFVAVGKRLHNVPIGAVQALVFGTVLLVGFLLGGPVGVGTLVSTFGAGLIMQLVFGLVRFDPRTVVQRDVVQVLREWGRA